MKTYKVKFTERIKRTPTIESFRFAQKEKIDFKAGQFLKLIFDENDLQDKELNKYLSFSNSPDKDYIEVTKRLSESAFSKKLNALKAGDEVLIQAPFGKCTIESSHKNIVFLVGGIGITPVISIIEDIVGKELNNRAGLIYSNRTEAEIAFKDKLDEWKDANKNIKICYTITEYQPKDKTYVFGRIDEGLINREIKDLKDCVFFIFGPPKMVEAIKKICLAAGIEEGVIKIESFIGY